VPCKGTPSYGAARLSGREPLLTARLDYRKVRALATRSDPNPMYRAL